MIEKIDGILGRVGGVATLKLVKKPGKNGWLEDMLYFFFGGNGLIFKGELLLVLGWVNLLIFECINKHI